MRTRKRVWIDFTYYEPRQSGSPIAANFQKTDSDEIAFIREADAKKEIAAWTLAAETWKKAYNDLVKLVFTKHKKRPIRSTSGEKK